MWVGVDSTLDIPYIASESQHPWVDGFTSYSAVRRWTSSVHGNLSVRFTYRKHADDCGDGVTLRVRKDSQAEPLWSAHCQDTTQKEVHFVVPVVAGSILDFVADPGTTDHCDTLLLSITLAMQERDVIGLSREQVRRQSGSSVLANSAADFGLPNWKDFFVRENAPHEPLPAVYHEGEATWRWRDSPQSWPMVRRDDVHPYRAGSEVVCAVQQVELSADESLFIAMDIRHQPGAACEATLSCGDGVHLTLSLDEKVLWEGDIFSESKEISTPILTLKSGSRVRAVTCPRENDVSDLLRIVIRLKYATLVELEN